MPFKYGIATMTDVTGLEKLTQLANASNEIFF
jgi:hypothetical protein